jgi:mono/diheme cytochrome c family protein
MRTAMMFSAAAVPIALAALWVGSGSIHAQDGALPGAEETEEVSADEEEILARGEYLVRSVAMCHECHTRRDPGGELILTELLMGAAMPVAPPVFTERWGRRAPGIAGLPGYTDAEAMRLFTQGITGRGTVARPPMPQFRFSDDDARAVIAYLRSL